MQLASVSVRAPAKVKSSALMAGHREVPNRIDIVNIKELLNLKVRVHHKILGVSLPSAARGCVLLRVNPLPINTLAARLAECSIGA